ncbi:MAG: CHAT domain-containing protein, partial [Microcystaceae cyanobacterium]
NDQSTAQLILQFYEILKNPQQSKAQAMRQAQLTLLKNSAYQHPYYWGPFILVGNWL